MAPRIGEKIAMQAIRTHREVGEIMGLTPSVVSVTESRAFKKLAKFFEDFDGYTREELKSAAGRMNRMRTVKRRVRN